MSAKLLLVLSLQVSLAYCAPILQYGMQPQLPLLRQLLPGNFNSPVVMYPQQPMMILLPKPQSNLDDRYIYLNEHNNKNKKEDLKSDTGFVDEDSEAVVLDAEPNTDNHIRKNGIILMPNQGRLGIGDIISYIPFLPIEINVPDTISWIINGIGGIGSWFRPQTEVPMDGNIKRISSKGPMMPILVMPLGRPMLPQMV